jgi:outer membrane protein assembly factor BamB
LLPQAFTINLYRVLATYALIVLSGFSLAAWWLSYMRPSWALRIAVPLGIVVVVVGAIRVEDVHFYGDMYIDYHFRWETVRPPQQTVATPTVFAAPKINLADAPGYRGRNRDGVVVGPKLARDWTAQPPPEIWRSGVGDGLGGFAVVGKLAITMEQREGEEAVTAYDTETGQLRWVHKYPAHFVEAMGGPGPRTTPTIVGDNVVTLGAKGDLFCLKITDGSVIWGPIPILAGNDNLPWAMSGSPLVCDLADGRSVVVVNPGNQNGRTPGRALVAFDLKDGKEVWAGGSGCAGYSSPQLNTLGGKRQILLFDGEGVAGHDPETGREWWRHAWKTHQQINVAQPIVVGPDRVFISSGYNQGCALLKITHADGVWSVEELWRKANKPLRLKMSSGVLRDGYIYGLDEGYMSCIDANSGELRWQADRKGEYGHGQILLTDDLIVVLGEKGHLALVEATPVEFRELGRIRPFKTKTWNIPTLVEGRLYIRNDKEMACYDLTGKPAK